MNMQRALNVLCTIGILTVALAGCASTPVTQEFRLPITEIETTGSSGDAHLLQPRDVLDVMYRFDMLEKDIYRLAPHDKLRIRFLTAPEYDDNYQIRPDGYISMPFIGEVQVAGRSVEDLRVHLESRYQSVLKKPDLHINLVEYQVHLKNLQTALFHPTIGASRMLAVRDDEVVSFPLIGEVSTADKTVAQVVALANDRYAQLNPALQVDIFLHKSETNRLFVFGEVNQPGAHDILTPVSLMQAIALAGGVNRDAQMGSVVVMKRQGSELAAKVYDLRSALRGKSDALTAQIGPEDIVYVPATRLSNGAETMHKLAELILFRGVGYNLTYRLDTKGSD